MTKMEKAIVLINPHSGHGSAADLQKKLGALLPDRELEFRDSGTIADWKEFFASAGGADLVLCGGDGTLNGFINRTDGMTWDGRILYYATGSGNDFLTDIGGKKGGAPVDVTSCLTDLPDAYVNGQKYKFLNNVSFGIDGYACEECDRIRAGRRTGRPVNYTRIALKGMLWAFKPYNAIVTVDGETREYHRVWLAPTMNGRYFGGGMMIAPGQDRLNPERKLSFVIIHNISRPVIAILFPAIFGGRHLKYMKYVAVIEGHEVTVRFDRPCALQMDGETILGVTEYTAWSVLTHQSTEVQAR